MLAGVRAGTEVVAEASRSMIINRPTAPGQISLGALLVAIAIIAVALAIWLPPYQPDTYRDLYPVLPARRMDDGPKFNPEPKIERDSDSGK